MIVDPGHNNKLAIDVGSLREWDVCNWGSLSLNQEVGVTSSAFFVARRFLRP